MKALAPIRRHPAIVSFSKDHHFGLLLVWKIRQGIHHSISAERISNYISFFFREDLAGHFSDEEKLLFNLLPANDNFRKQAEADHLAIYKIITDIEESKNDTSLLIQLADLLEKHIRFEERELFNHLQENIGEIELVKISERLSNSSKSIDGKWEDSFWECRKQ